MERMIHVVEGNGQPGLAQITRDFIAEWRGAEKEKEKQVKKADRKWNFRIAFITLFIGAAELYFHGCAGARIALLQTAKNAQQDAGVQTQTPSGYVEK